MYIGKGLEAIKKANEGGNQLLKLKNGESTEVRILTPADQIISVYEHTEKFGGRWYTLRCLGKDNCPLCKAGKNASFRSYIVLFDRKDEKVKIFKASSRAGKNLAAQAEEYGDITKRDFKILRQGDGFQTTYQFFPRDPSEFDASELELPNVEALIKPKSPEEIMELMKQNQEVKNVTPSSFEETGGFPF